MKLFQLNDEYSVVCVSERTRSGFLEVLEGDVWRKLKPMRRE